MGSFFFFCINAYKQFCFGEMESIFICLNMFVDIFQGNSCLMISMILRNQSTYRHFLIPLLMVLIILFIFRINQVTEKMLPWGTPASSNSNDVPCLCAIFHNPGCNEYFHISIIKPFSLSYFASVMWTKCLRNDRHPPEAV